MDDSAISSEREKIEMESIERLSFELSVRALAERERMLAGMRATAGTLVAAASVVASLRTPSPAHVSSEGALALITCTLSVGCAVWVLLPHGVAFTVRGADLRLVKRQRDSRALPEAHFVVSLWMDRQVRANKRALARVGLVLSLGCILLLIEIFLLTVATAW